MFVILLGLLLLLPGCSAAPGTASSAPAKTILDEAAAAMGGWDALDAVKSQEVFTTANDLEHMQAVEPDTTERKNIIKVLYYKNSGQPVELQIGGASKLPLRVIYTEDDPIYGDTLNELAFFAWHNYNGVQLPETMATFLNGNKIRE